MMYVGYPLGQQPRRDLPSSVPTTRASDAQVPTNDPKGGEANSLQKFASVHANVHNHFNQDCQLIDRET